MHESAYTARVNDKVKSRLRRVWKIKADMQGGVLDCYYLGDKDLWVEYKLIKAFPKRLTTIILPNLQPLQALWLDDLYYAQKNSMVVVGIERVEGFRGCGSVPFYNPKEWLSGITMEEASNRLMDYNAIADLIVSRCNHATD